MGNGMGTKDDALEIQFGRDAMEMRGSETWSPITRRQALRGGLALAIGGSTALWLGCGGGEAASGGAEAGGLPGAGKTLGVSLNGLNEWSQANLTGVIEALKGTGYKLVARQATYDSSKEVAQLENLVSQQVDGIIIFPNTIQSAGRGAMAAKAAGIPVLYGYWVSETPADEAYLAVYGTNHPEGGKMVADYLMEQLPDGGEVILVPGVQGQGFSEVYSTGLKESLGEKWPIVAEQPGNWSRSVALDVTENMLTAHPDAKAVVVYSMEMSYGVSTYLKRAKREDVIHVTSDAGEGLVPALRDGSITACRYYSMAEGGKWFVDTMRAFLEKDEKPAEFVNWQPQRMVTKADVKGDEPGVLNPDLDSPWGRWEYPEHLAEAQKTA
jgi:ribose transport system substrate-binding protein